MKLIIFVVSLIVLTILYRRMIQREIPSPIDKPQAIVPIVLGVVSIPLAFAITFGITLILSPLGVSFSGLPPFPRSVADAAYMAGVPEELAKLIMMLICLHAFKSKIKNVYEYILVGAAVGFGFTLLEEFLYGTDNIITIVARIITLAGHMTYGIIMSKHLGTARYNKKHGEGSVSGEYVKAILIPMVIHTLYDTFTAENRLLSTGDENIELLGFILGVISIILMFILQFIVIGGFKKNTEKYCAMDV